MNRPMEAIEQLREEMRFSEPLLTEDQIERRVVYAWKGAIGPAVMWYATLTSDQQGYLGAFIAQSTIEETVRCAKWLEDEDQPDLAEMLLEGLPAELRGG